MRSEEQARGWMTAIWATWGFGMLTGSGASLLIGVPARSLLSVLGVALMGVAALLLAIVVKP